MPDTITLPILDLSDADFGAVFMADEDQRWRVVNKLASDHNITIPDAWHNGPLQGWCYLVLAVNKLEPTPEPKPLVHWGIDLMFASEAVNKFVWFLA